jgi:hypothetical protein
VRVRLAVGLACLLLAPTLPGRAGAAPDRVVKMAYAAAAGYTTGTSATLWGAPTATATSQSDEDRVVVTAADKGGGVALVIDVTTPDGATTRQVTCTELTVSVKPGTTVEATPVTGRCNDGHVSLPQGGEVALSFHKRPVPPRPPAPQFAPPSMRWAVLIGVQDYAGRTHSTVGAHGDVKAIRAALLAAGWRADHILVLKDSQATAQGIRRAFAWLAARSTPRTFSLLHFSGHVCIASRGPCKSGHAYLWAQDNRFLSEDEVRSRMLQVRGHSWLDVAGCEAGAFDQHSANRLFTASSRANETSYENPDWKQSYWTGLVWARGFSKGLADDKRVAHRATIYEMVRYGRKLAPGMTKRGQRGPQHPVVAGGSSRWTLYAPPGG